MAQNSRVKKRESNKKKILALLKKRPSFKDLEVVSRDLHQRKMMTIRVVLSQISLRMLSIMNKTWITITIS